MVLVLHTYILTLDCLDYLLFFSAMFANTPVPSELCILFNSVVFYLYLLLPCITTGLHCYPEAGAYHIRTNIDCSSFEIKIIYFRNLVVRLKIFIDLPYVRNDNFLKFFIEVMTTIHICIHDLHLRKA